MSIYLDEKNPGKHKPFEDASPDIVEYVRYLEVIAGKSANTAFSYFCDLRGFSRFMKRRRGLVPADSEMQDIDPKGLDTAFWASVTKEDIYEYLFWASYAASVASIFSSTLCAAPALIHASMRVAPQSLSISPTGIPRARCSQSPK